MLGKRRGLITFLQLTCPNAYLESFTYSFFYLQIQCIYLEKVCDAVQSKQLIEGKPLSCLFFIKSQFLHEIT